MLLNRFFKGTENFTGLLYLLLAIFIFVPFVHGHALAEEIFVSAFSLALLYTLYNLYGNHRRFKQITIAGLTALTSNIVAYLTPYETADVTSLLLNTLFFGLAVILMFQDIFRTRTVSLNIILGAICVYLLMGIVWGMVYELIEVAIPHSFHITDTAETLSHMDALIRYYIYYSFATLSTLGAADISPISSPARYFSALEAISGQIYLSVLIARLVGMHITQK